MVRTVVHKEGSRYVLEVPANEVARFGLVDGQEVDVTFAPVISDDERRKRIDEIMDKVVVEYREAFEYLAR
jgi:antitoxin component of MazEF toxin-antitoxin module